MVAAQRTELDPVETASVTKKHRYYLGGLTGTESVAAFADFLRTSTR